MRYSKNIALPVEKNDFKHLYPFASHYAKINGRDYHYVDEGQGNPVVMVHGNPTWSFYFRNLISGLTPDFRAIAPDHIGCGLSEKPSDKDYDFTLKNRLDDFDQFMTHLNLDKKITLLVHDWGGMIAMAWAVKHPKKIAGIIVLNTAAFLPPDNKPLPKRLKWIRNIPWFAQPAVLGLNLFARAALYMAPYKKLPGDVKKGLLAPYNCRHNRVATLKFVQDIPLTDADESCAIVKNTDAGLHLLSDIPMLILWGKHDFVFDEDYFSQWKKRFPRASTRLFTHAGHYILEDQPEAVLAEIRFFLEQNPI